MEINLNDDVMVMTVQVPTGPQIMTLQVPGVQGIPGPTGPAGPGLPTGGTANQVIYKVNGTDYNTGWKTLAKSDVGLSNVDNTSDANKPVSTATQTALDGKANTSHTHTSADLPSATTAATGVVELATSGEATTGTDTTRAVTPAGLKAVADTKAALSHTHGVTDLTATGTKDTTTFLRGDNTWAVPAGSGGAADATTTTKGIVQLTNHLGGTATAPTVRSASDTQTGIVELATDAETQTGTDTARAITPANLSARTGTTSRTGVLQLATTAEATTGTDTAKAVTAAGVKAVADLKLNLKNNATVALTANTDYVGKFEIQDDGTSSAAWPSRLEFYYKPLAGTAVLTSYFNEYGEFRGISGKTNTIPFRLFTKRAPGDAAHTVDMMQVADDRTNVNILFNVDSAGAAYSAASVGSNTTQLVPKSYVDAATKTASQISDSTTVGRAVLTAASADAARQAIKITQASVAPSSPATGDIWIDTSA